MTGGNFTGCLERVRRHRRGFHEHADASQEARRNPFSPAPVARDVLTYRELPVSGACRTDARLVGEVKDRPRKLDVPSTSKGRMLSHRVVTMSGFPTQLPWRRFACLLRDLGYRPLKSHRGSGRQFFNPTRRPNLVSFHEPHPGATHCTKQPCTTLYGSSSSARMNLFSCLGDVEQSR